MDTISVIVNFPNVLSVCVILFALFVVNFGNGKVTVNRQVENIYRRKESEKKLYEMI